MDKRDQRTSIQAGGGGYPQGFRYPAAADGRRLFRVKITPELQNLLRFPEGHPFYGQFFSKKPIEAAAKAYTSLCRYFEGECPEMPLTVIDLTALTKKGPKENTYWINRRPNSRRASVGFSSGRKAQYRWRYDVVPRKAMIRPDAETTHALHAQVARARYSRLAVKPRRYSKRK